MKKTRLGLVSLFVVAAFVVVGCAPAGPTPGEPIELTFALGYPQEHVMGIAATYWVEQVEERSGGRLKPVMFWGQALGKVTTYGELLEAGGCDVALLIWPYIASKPPLLQVPNLPFFWPSGDVTSRVYYELYYDGYFDDELAKFQPLYLFSASPYNYIGTEPMHTPADMKGVQIRSGGGPWTPTIEAWGAVPVHFPSAEVYPGIEKGLVEGTLLSVASSYGLKLHEVADHVTLINVGGYGGGVCMNMDVYNSLPKDLQKVLDDVFDDMMENNVGKIYDQKDVEGLKAFQDAGAAIYIPTPQELELWKAPARGVVDNWIAEMEAKGLPAGKMVDDLVAIAAKYGATPY